MWHDRHDRNTQITKKDYQIVIKKSSYKTKLQYKESNNNNNKYSTENSNINNTSKKQRKCKIIWFNPSYKKNVVENVAKILLKLLDKHFPKTSRLYKIFNRNSVINYISYNCRENISQIINSHNKNVLK